MAAGEGERLRPLTERWPKPVLPIDGRPIVATLLRELRAADVDRVTLVTGHLAESVESLVGDGSGFDLEVSYVRQPEPDGSADAVRRALDAGAVLPTIVCAADTVFPPGALARFVAAAADAAAAVAFRSGQPSSGAKPGIVVEDGRVVRVWDKDAADEFTSVPLWWLGEEVAPHLAGLPGPPFELKDAYQRAIDAGTEVLAVEVSGTRDLTRPVDLLVENFPYLAGA
jgi:NDP-sugar pyrophosphorylase family protein